MKYHGNITLNPKVTGSIPVRPTIKESSTKGWGIRGSTHLDVELVEGLDRLDVVLQAGGEEVVHAVIIEAGEVNRADPVHDVAHELVHAGRTEPPRVSAPVHLVVADLDVQCSFHDRGRRRPHHLVLVHVDGDHLRVFRQTGLVHDLQERTARLDVLEGRANRYRGSSPVVRRNERDEAVHVAVAAELRQPVPGRDPAVALRDEQQFLLSRGREDGPDRAIDVVGALLQGQGQQVGRLVYDHAKSLAYEPGGEGVEEVADDHAARAQQHQRLAGGIPFTRGRLGDVE